MSTRDIVIAFRAAAIADAFRAPDAQQRADALYALASAIPLEAPDGSLLAEPAFDALVGQLELLPANRIFDASMLAGEVLAACVLASAPHAPLLQRWTAREHQGPRLAAMRASSKLCEYDTALVDGEMLRALAAHDDIDEATIGYLAQVAGRLRGEEKGERLIEQLAEQAPPRRVLAAHAITYSVAMDPPFAKLTAFARYGPSRLVSGPPSRRMLRLLSGLMADADPEVANAAAMAAGIGREAWPEMGRLLANLQANIGGLPREKPAATAEKNPRAIDFGLRSPGRISTRAGKLSWDPGLLEEERAAALDGTTLPRAIGAPRLFLSYRWADDPTSDTLIDHVAGLFHMTGYDVVFDRDPRQLDAGRSAEDVRNLMQDCTHFVPLATSELCRYFEQKHTGPKSALDLEWELARKLARRASALRWVTLWLDGERLPRLLANRPHLDLRESHELLSAVFPRCEFVVDAFDAKGKRIYRSAAVSRSKLRAVFLQALKRRGAARCEIRDVTRRRKLAALS